MSEQADTEAQVSRDERHDSIDPATGTLTDEAVALRRAAAEGVETEPVEAVEVEPAETEAP